MSSKDLASSPANTTSSSSMSGSPIQSVEYVKNGEAHLLMMKKIDAGQVLAYHSSHASHASHSSHIASQNNLADSLNNAINDAKDKFPGLEVVKSGVIFFASATSKSVEKDISIIGLVSGLLALALILLVFRSLYAVGIVLITVLIAFLYAVMIYKLCLGLIESSSKQALDFQSSKHLLVHS